MNEVIVKLEDGKYLHMQFGESEFTHEGCDMYVDFTLYDPDKSEVDGGQMDFNSGECDYESILDTINDTIAFALVVSENDKLPLYEITNLSLEDDF